MNKKLAMSALALALFGGASAYAVAHIAADDLTNERPPKTVMEAGEAAYLANCAACHQPTGTGLAGAFPPLAKSDYLAAMDRDTLIDSVLEGVSGKITVNGVDYDNVMPPMAHLSDADIALTAPPSVDQAAFDAAAARLRQSLPPVFSLQSTFPMISVTSLWMFRTESVPAGHAFHW